MKKITIKNNLKRDTSLGMHITGSVTMLDDISQSNKNVIVEATIASIEIEETDNFIMIRSKLKDSTGGISAVMIKLGNKIKQKEFMKNIKLKNLYRINGKIIFDEVFVNDIVLIATNLESLNWFCLVVN